jgi:hypothetical protein
MRCAANLSEIATEAQVNNPPPKIMAPMKNLRRTLGSTPAFASPGPVRRSNDAKAMSIDGIDVNQSVAADF